MSREPSAFRVALAADMFDGVGKPVIRAGPGRAEVVQAAEDVVSVARRECELQEIGMGDLPGRFPAIHAALDQVLLTAQTRIDQIGIRAASALVLEQAFEDVDRRSE